MDNRRNYFFLIIAVIAFGMMLTGGTYAWLTFNTTTVGNNIISGDSTCFVIDYSGSFEGGVLFPSKTDKGGLMATATLSINQSCNVNAVGYVKLNVGTGTDSKFFAKDGSNNYVLNYSIYDSNGTTKLGSGAITGTGDITLNTSTITLTKTPTTYYVYVWLNGAHSLVDNSYLNLPFSGTLKASATQVE